MKNGGFSILELIVVIAIIGIVATIAGISAKGWLDKYQVESQMKQMLVDLMNARASAMQKNRMYFVKLAGTQYTVYEDTSPGPDGNGSLEEADDTLIVRKNLSAIYGITFPADEIDFDSRGLVSRGLVGAQQQAVIRVNGSFGASSDCIVVTTTRTKLGGWDGSNCIAQ